MHISQRGLRRLADFDYSQAGAYAFRLAVTGRREVLSRIEDAAVHLLPVGEIVQRHWNDLPKRYQVVLDELVIMPDHVHGILWIDDLKSGPRARPTLSDIMRGFKTFTAIEINNLLGTRGRSFWQRNYYEHIIRHGADLRSAREYMRENPVRWELKHKDEPTYLTK
jgi:REP element-mobilizing transposase RayT